MDRDGPWDGLGLFEGRWPHGELLRVGAPSEQRRWTFFGIRIFRSVFATLRIGIQNYST
jgi:hypothetical protein